MIDEGDNAGQDKDISGPQYFGGTKLTTFL